MVSKEPGANNKGKLSTETVGTGKKVSAQTKKKSQPDDGRESVFVRISEKANAILKGAAKAPRTKATVIEALLEYFNNEKNQAIREMILDKKNIDPIEEHGELLELRSWAEHAFENGRYVWASTMYKTLADHRSSSEGLKNICKYRLSVCLIRLSYDVREEALRESIDKDAYFLALKTLDMAIRYTGEVENKLGGNLLFPRLVLYYNLASCHSLKAQYMVESELPDDHLIDKLRDAKKNADAREEVWKSIGVMWRSNQKGRNVERAVDDEAEMALYELRKILPLSAQGDVLTNEDGVKKDDGFSERTWMVGSSLTDEDFIFLRSDKQEWQPKFYDWTSKVLGDRKPNVDAVKALLSRLRETPVED